MKNDSLLKEVAAIVAMALFVGFTFNALSGKGLPLLRVPPVKVAVDDSAIFGGPSGAAADTPSVTGTGTTGGEPGAAPGDAPSFRVITLEQMKRAVDSRRGMLFDARTAGEYSAGHIPGAWNLYAMAPEEWIDRVAEVPRDTLVLIYCSNPHCPFGRTLAEFLGQFGFTNLLLFDDGWDRWSAAGLPSAAGKEEPAR